MTDNINGWNEWGKHVLSEIKRLNEVVNKLDKTIDDFNVELARLKVKMGIYASIASVIVSAIITTVILTIWG